MSEPIYISGNPAPVTVVKSAETVPEKTTEEEGSCVTIPFTRCYNTFSGADIRAYADGLVIETLQAIGWDIDFETRTVTGWMRFIRFDGKENFTPVKWSKKPFDLRLVAANEYGAAMWMQIGQIKFLTCHSGSAIDDLVIEERATFEAPLSEFAEWTSYEGEAAQKETASELPSDA